MKLYRVNYVHRPNPAAALVEKTALVVAETELEAASHIDRQKGNEVKGVVVEKPDVQVAGKGK